VKFRSCFWAYFFATLGAVLGGAPLLNVACVDDDALRASCPLTRPGLPCVINIKGEVVYKPTREQLVSLGYLDAGPCRFGEAQCLEVLNHKGGGNDFQVICDGHQHYSPRLEQCDGIDNDCDGMIDNDVAYQSQSCGRSDLGECVYGALVCTEQRDLECVGATYPLVDPHTQSEAFCDGLDEDCDGLIDEDLERRCDFGCGPGFEKCVHAAWADCDAPLPTSEDTELCNGKDDDCDGDIDEGQKCQCEAQTYISCAPEQGCGTGRKDCSCQNGVCDYGDCYLACDVGADNLATPWGVCPAEDCNGWDDNCNGQIDEGIVMEACPCTVDSASWPFCDYEPCSAGYRSCDEGAWSTCLNVKLPGMEICDRIDNNCNGQVDEGLANFERVDLVFAVDITSSMEHEIQMVHDALREYVEDFRLSEHRFALILYPAPSGNIDPTTNIPIDNCQVGEDSVLENRTGGLVNIDSFLQALNSITLQCGLEPSYDVVQRLSDPADPAAIGWRPDAFPYVVVIGDEYAQSWFDVDEAIVYNQTRNCHGIGGCPQTSEGTIHETWELHCIFPPHHFSDWDSFCTNHSLNTISAQMLRGVFRDVCLDPVTHP
jgi:hypothetical protein